MDGVIDWIVGALLVLCSLAVLGLVVFVIIAVVVDDGDPGYVQRGTVVGRGDHSVILRWCEPHAKVSDKLIETTIYEQMNEDGTVEVRRRDVRVGTC